MIAPAKPSARLVTLITGASAGLGAELAHVFAEHGHRLVLIARREERLTALADAIAVRGHARPIVLPMDLQLPGAADRIDAALKGFGVEPNVVVNNAGFGLSGRAADLDRAEQLAMIDLNVRALTDLSLKWIDQLERHNGGILNVASVAGFLPGPGMAVYYATKAYVLSLSEALHQELKPRGIQVTALCPGPTPTEFQARAGVPGKEGPALLTLPAERVAREGYRGFVEGHRVVVPGFANRIVSVLARIVPRRLLLRAVDGRQKARKPSHD
jgi:short-subunit dehydrogenase